MWEFECLVVGVVMGVIVVAPASVVLYFISRDLARRLKVAESLLEFDQSLRASERDRDEDRERLLRDLAGMTSGRRVAEERVLVLEAELRSILRDMSRLMVDGDHGLSGLPPVPEITEEQARRRGFLPPR